MLTLDAASRFPLATFDPAFPPFAATLVDMSTSSTLSSFVVRFLLPFAVVALVRGLSSVSELFFDAVVAFFLAGGGGWAGGGEDGEEELATGSSSEAASDLRREGIDSVVRRRPGRLREPKSIWRRFL